MRWLISRITSYNVCYTKLLRVSVSKQKEHIPLAIEKRQMSTEFEIEIPYSIPSDNQPYDVTMIEYQVAASYQYSAVPKLSDDSYNFA